MQLRPGLKKLCWTVQLSERTHSFCQIIRHDAFFLINLLVRKAERCTAARSLPFHAVNEKKWLKWIMWSFLAWDQRHKFPYLALRWGCGGGYTGASPPWRWTTEVEAELVGAWFEARGAMDHGWIWWAKARNPDFWWWWNHQQNMMIQSWKWGLKMFFLQQNIGI